MANIDLCQVETVEVRGWNGKPVKAAPAHRYQDFAVHRWPGKPRERWRLSHLPSGLLVASGFQKIEKAVDAMIEIARLRNDWAVIGHDDLTPDLKQKVSDVANRHGGIVKSGRREFAADLNGYDAMQV